MMRAMHESPADIFHGFGRRAFVAALLFALSLVGITGPEPAVAQEYGSRDWNQSGDPYVAAIGLAAGITGGTGLAVRWPGFPQVMLGLAGGVWRRDDDTDWNLGFETHLVLRQSGRTRLFIGPAIMIYGDDDDPENDIEYNASFGVGIEYLLNERISGKFDVGFTYQGDDGDILTLPQAGLFYYF